MEIMNFKCVDENVTLIDARSCRDNFSLDRNGFQYFNADEVSMYLTDALKRWERDKVQQFYYSYVEALVKKATSASYVIIFDHTLRKRDPKRNKTDNTTGKEQPAKVIY